MYTVYEQLQAYLRESDSNVLQLTKQLDNANAAHKVTVEALEAADKEKRREVEAEVARLLGEKKEMEAKLESVEAYFVANFYNTEAYTNFSDYFARVGHQEVLAVLRAEHSDLDLGPLQARFSPLEEEGS
ncbi:hypothetical protein Adt_07063 [Abeliophyllum distichum]|uniref:Uncharacterized protein n=1 Tax=Abeliophyllum distichum TaxID=126358 RepID=A0ABD1V8N6_9LAMI